MKQWIIPPRGSASFVADMEHVLDVYEAPYDADAPVVNLDEKPYQMLGHVREPMPMRVGDAAHEDYEYERRGTCNAFMLFEPLRGWRHVEVRVRRTARDFADVVRYLADEVYPHVARIRLVCDNLNTHKAASLYEAFAPEQARRIARRVEFVYTPKHGSWLNVAEIELSVLSRQCLSRRLGSIEQVGSEVAAWEQPRNAAKVGARWRFRTEDARIKLHHLYPSD